MSLPATYSEISSPPFEASPVSRVLTLSEAQEVASFLLQPHQFGTPLTPGERDDFHNAPLLSISGDEEIFWLVRGQDQAIAATAGIRQHVNRTGIYQIIAFAVHRNHRHQGLGRLLLSHALSHIRDIKGRGLIFDTSAHSSYLPMQKLLTAMQFQLVGRFPDFYFPGEDTLWYFRAVDSSSLA